MGVKMLHYVSTIGVYNGHISEKRYLLSPASINLSLSSGYNQSKWVAEKLLVNVFSQAGMPLLIHRPDLVSGHRDSGVCNTRDWSTLLLAGIMQMRKAPICIDDKIAIEWIPVDRLVPDIVALSREMKPLALSHSYNYRISAARVEGFNFINSHSGRIALNQLFEWLGQFMQTRGESL